MELKWGKPVPYSFKCDLYNMLVEEKTSAALWATNSLALKLSNSNKIISNYFSLSPQIPFLHSPEHFILSLVHVVQMFMSSLGYWMV
jgi:hypothetical protein